MNFLSFCILLSFWTVSVFGEPTVLTEIATNFETAGSNYKDTLRILSSASRTLRLQLGKTKPVQLSEIAESKIEKDTSELNKGNHEGNFFEGDIVLTNDQAVEVLESLRSPTRRKKRKVTSNTNIRWPKAIPFELVKDVDDAKAKIIMTAFEIIAKETCLEFVPRTNEKDYIVFFTGIGCYSSVGRTGGRQGISIGLGCDSIGIVLHEICHALGIWHEQSRHDRDNYISLIDENIKDGTEYNFIKKRESTLIDFGQPYDYGSDMHYNSRAFSIDYYSKHTIVPHDSKYINTIGQRETLSFIDIKQINDAYCTDNCKSSQDCKNHGYPDPRDCSKCKCPNGLGGPTCSEAHTSITETCGGNLDFTVSADPVLIASPNYPRLSPDIQCNWYIKAPLLHRIVLNMTEFDFHCGYTCSDYVEIKAISYGNDTSFDFRQTGMRLCCKEMVETIYSDTNEAIIILRTKYGYGSGFKMSVTTEQIKLEMDTGSKLAIAFGVIGLVIFIALVVLLYRYLYSKDLTNKSNYMRNTFDNLINQSQSKVSGLCHRPAPKSFDEAPLPVVKISIPQAKPSISSPQVPQRPSDSTLRQTVPMYRTLVESATLKKQVAVINPRSQKEVAEEIPTLKDRIKMFEKNTPNLNNDDHVYAELENPNRLKKPSNFVDELKAAVHNVPTNSLKPPISKKPKLTRKY